MNFLKISGLVIGTGSVVGGTGAGIYYVTNRKDNIAEKSETEADQKVQFTGKLVFLKKTGRSTEATYGAELLNDSEYSAKVIEFDTGKGNDEKHAQVNKVVEISHELNVQKAKTKLKEIWTEPLTLEDIKSILSSKAEDIKSLFNDDIYKKLKTEFGVPES